MRGLSLACAAACVLATLATAASAGGLRMGVFAAPHGGFAPHGGAPAFAPHGGPMAFGPHGGPMAFRPHGGPAFGGRVAPIAPAPGFAYRAPTAEDRFDHGGGIRISRTFGGEGCPQRYGYARNLRYGHGYGHAYGFGYGHRDVRSYGWGAGLGFIGSGYAYPGAEAPAVEVSAGPLVLIAPNFDAFAGPAASASGGPRIIFVNRDKKTAAAGEKLPQVVYGDAPNESVGGPKIIYGDSWN